MRCEFNSHIHDEFLIETPSKSGVFQNPLLLIQVKIFQYLLLSHQSTNSRPEHQRVLFDYFLPEELPHMPTILGNREFHPGRYPAISLLFKSGGNKVDSGDRFSFFNPDPPSYYSPPESHAIKGMF